MSAEAAAATGIGWTLATHFALAVTLSAMSVPYHAVVDPTAEVLQNVLGDLFMPST